MRSGQKRWIGGWLLVGWLLVGVVHGDERIPCERRLPKETLMFVSLHNVPQLKDQLRKTIWGQLLTDEGLSEFRELLQREFQQASENLHKDLGLSLDDLLGLPGGEASLAIAKLPGKTLGMSLFFDFGDKRESFEKLFEQTVQRLEKQGFTRKEDDIEDTRLLIFTPPVEKDKAPRAGKNNDDDNPEAETPTVCFVRDSFLVVCDSVEMAKAVLARWDGKHDGVFAENEALQYIRERCRHPDREEPAQGTWYLDVLGLLRNELGKAEGGAQNAAFLALLPRLGLDKFRAIGGTIDFAEGDLEVVARTLVYVDQPPTGVFEALQFPAAPLAIPEWVPLQIVAYQSLNWNIEKAYATMERLVDSFQGAGTVKKAVDELSQQPQLGGLHLQRDVVDLLAGGMHLLYDFENPEDFLTIRAMVALQVKDANAAKRTLAKLASIPGVGLKPREFRGEQILEIPLPDFTDDEEAEKPAAKPRAMGVCVARNHLFLTSNVRLLEQALSQTKGEESLAQNAGFRSLARHFPEQISLVSYQNYRSYYRSLWKTLRGADRAAPRPRGDAPPAPQLPAFDKVSKYFPTAAGGYVHPDRHGWLFVAFVAKQADEK